MNIPQQQFIVQLLMRKSDKGSKPPAGYKFLVANKLYLGVNGKRLIVANV